MSEYEDKINGLTDKMEQTDKGQWFMPEEIAKDLDEGTLYSVGSERRRRTMQSGLTKANQESKRQAAVASGLQEHILSSGIALPREQEVELAGLKKTDPDAWKDKLTEYEASARTTLATELTDIASSAGSKSDLEVRSEQMAAWSKSTGIELNDDVIAEKLPAGLLKRLETGALGFEGFLDEAGQFLTGKKVIKGADENLENDYNLSKVPGGPEPDTRAQNADENQAYEGTLF